jgi:serine/threonine protein kinase
VSQPAITTPAVSKLGKYELRGVVGSGASGTVFDAWDPDLRRRVAIKQVDLAGRTQAQQQELKARFQQEAQIAGRLSHPNVVGVYDYGEQGGSAFLVMEFVDGETLAAVLQGMRERRETMPVRRAVGIVHAILLALAACHRKGVLHRDIKPGNVMLARDGAVKLMDFGIARDDVSDLTARGTLIGTPAYMSPEQFEAHHPVDERSDLYACGVVLYEVLAGHKPFEGDLFAVMHQVRTEIPMPPSRGRTLIASDGGAPGGPQAVPMAHPALDAIVLRAMAKRPEDRFTDADSFAADLLHSLDDPSWRSWWGSRRRRGFAVVAGVVVLATVGFGSWHLLQTSGPQGGGDAGAARPGAVPAPGADAAASWGARPASDNPTDIQSRR